MTTRTSDPAVASQFRLGKNFSVYAVRRLVAMLISVVLLPIFTHELPPAESGVIGILWLVVPLLSRAINLGLDVAMSLKFFKLSHAQLASHLYNTLLAITGSGLAVLLLGCWRLEWVQAVLHPSITRGIFALLVGSIVMSIYTTMMQSFLQLSNKPVHNVIATISPPVLIVAITYLLITSVNRSYVSYIVGMAVSYGLFGTLALSYFLTRYPLRHFRPSFITLRQMLRIGLPVVPGTAGAIILASGDRYIIKEFLGLEAVAIYTYGYRIAEYLSIGLYEPFQKALAPIMYEQAARDLNTAAEYSTQIVRYSLTVVPLVLALLILPSKEVLEWLGGNAYDESYAVFLLAVFGVLLYSTAQINSILLNHLERTELDMIAVLMGGGLNIALNLWFVPRFGLIAAAGTTIVSYLFILGFVVVVLNRLVPKQLRLAGVASMLLPFPAYLAGVFYVDVVAGLPAAYAYPIKVGLFALMLAVTWIAFPEPRRQVIAIVSRRTASNAASPQ